MVHDCHMQNIELCGVTFAEGQKIHTESRGTGCLNQIAATWLRDEINLISEVRD